MKNLILLLAVLLLVSCQKDQEKTKEIPSSQISGTIDNPRGEKIYFYTTEGKLEAPLVDGKYSFDLKIEEPSYIRFKHGPESSTLYLKPGQKLQLDLDTEAFDETIKYSGEAVAESNYLAAKYLLSEKVGLDTRTLFSKTPTQFTAKVDEVRAKLSDYLNQYKTEHKELNPDFLKTEAAQITYEWANSKLNYPQYHKYFSDDEDVDLGADYDQYLTSLELDNGDLLSSSNYKSFLDSYLSKITQDKINENPSEHNNPSLTKMNLLLNKFKHPAIKDLLMFNTVKSHISNKGTKDTEELMALFDKECKNEEFKSKIVADYEVWKKLAVGEAAPQFAYLDIEGKKVALSDLKGKFVYIDVWATWCGPCLAELPHLEKLQEKYAENENLVFASVSIDEDKDAWEKMVKEKEMMGVQLIADKAWKSSIATDYKDFHALSAIN